MGPYVTDTIRRMKSNVEGMEQKMEELQATIASTSEKSDTVNSKLGRVVQRCFRGVLGVYEGCIRVD